MKTLFTILTIASLVFLSSCDLFDNDPELPPITTEGKNTFGCYVNGKLFVNEAHLGYGSGVRAEIHLIPDTAGINIYAGNIRTKQHLIISIFDTPTMQLDKIYSLTDSKFYIKYTNYSLGLASCRYLNVSTGSIKLLKFEVSNPQKMIISGTFEFTASSADCHDTIIVTNGRFDIRDVTN